MTSPHDDNQLSTCFLGPFSERTKRRARLHDSSMFTGINMMMMRASVCHRRWSLAAVSFLLMVTTPVVGAIMQGENNQPLSSSPLLFRVQHGFNNNINKLQNSIDQKMMRLLQPNHQHVLLEEKIRGGGGGLAAISSVVPMKMKVFRRGGVGEHQQQQQQPTGGDNGGITATMPEHIFNLVKAIVGVGVLGLPACIAAASGSTPSALIPAILLITCMGILSAIGFFWIAQVCAMSHSSSYRQAWSKTVSAESSWIVAASATVMTFLACLAFSIVLADTLTTLFTNSSNRTTVLWTLTLTVLAPLCWMKQNILQSLAPFSMLGVLGMVYTAIAMTFRYLRGSYLGGSPLLEQVPHHLHPSFATTTTTTTNVGGWQSIFTLVSMLSTAYMCHFHAPKFYLEFKDNTTTTIPPSRRHRRRRFNTVVAASFGISITLTIWISVVGFATFGQACSSRGSMILNNYARKSDVCMSLSRLAVVVSLMASYPLHFTGLRDGVLDLMKIPETERSNDRLNKTTLGLLLVLTVLATKVKDVSFILAFGGATLGNLLCFVYPAIMFARVSPAHKIPATALAVMGIVFGIIGATLALQK